MSALHFKNLSGGPGHADILQHLDISFGPGLTGLVGPNGAGKTTILRTAMGLLTPRAGTVGIDDKPLADLSLRERARAIAYLPQNGPVHWAMTVVDIVRLGRFSCQTGTNEDDVAIDRAMTACAVDGFASRLISTLSGGERSRVLLARALAAQTGILLVDEPTNALDPAQQHRIMAILQSRARAGTNVICALHDLPLAARYCDRLVFLQDGKIIEDGVPATVLTAASFSAAYGLHFDKRGYLADEHDPQ